MDTELVGCLRAKTLLHLSIESPTEVKTNIPFPNMLTRMKGCPSISSHYQGHVDQMSEHKAVPGRWGLVLGLNCEAYGLPME